MLNEINTEKKTKIKRIEEKFRTSMNKKILIN